MSFPNSVCSYNIKLHFQGGHLSGKRPFLKQSGVNDLVLHCDEEASRDSTYVFPAFFIVFIVVMMLMVIVVYFCRIFIIITVFLSVHILSGLTTDHSLTSYRGRNRYILIEHTRIHGQEVGAEITRLQQFSLHCIWLTKHG